MITLIIFGAALTITSVSQGQETTTKKVDCPNNEKWVDCEEGYCGPKKCDDLGYPVMCPGIWGSCAGGCVCIEGFVRNSEDVCIPEVECPKCGGDLNATVGDGHYCGNLCSNYFEDQSKFDECKKQWPTYNGCKCKPGFVYNDIIEQCVDPRDCPKPCNGDYYAAPQSCPSSCQPTCANPKFDVCTDDCNPSGCACVSGYVLDKYRGKCVKIDNCPDNLGCNGDPNAIITSCGGCGYNCEQKNGEIEPFSGTFVCTPGTCCCKIGYIRSINDKWCILESECRKRANSSSHEDQEGY